MTNDVFKEILITLGDVPFERIEEIMQAERDGRCVVLPCKVGDTVFAAYEGIVHGGMVEKISCSVSGWSFKTTNETNPILMWNWFSNIGRTVFLTRVEAEEALDKEAQHE